MIIYRKKLLASLAVPLAVGGLSALLTKDSMETFDSLNKPALSPPGWLFPVVWTVLFVLMGHSLLPCCHVRQKQPRGSYALRRTAFLQSALVTDIFQSRSVSGGFCMACSAVAAYFSDNGSFLPHFKTGGSAYAAVSVMGYIRRLS